jgi:trans-aconitate methyltransferase
MNISINDWLTAREVADARFRSSELAISFATLVGNGQDNRLIVDLACGTGANIRYLAPYLAIDQNWLGIDCSDEMLLNAAVRLSSTPIAFRKEDLATGIESIPTGKGVAITASAFLDLTSANWLNRMAIHCCHSPLLIAMSTVSQPQWNPEEEWDESIRSVLERHQRADHGFGPSLGPDAAVHLADQLRSLGCRVELRQSDWILNSTTDDPLIDLMIGGTVRRVESMSDTINVREWENKRRSQRQRGNLQVVVKHLDLLSIPPQTELEPILSSHLEGNDS